MYVIYACVHSVKYALGKLITFVDVQVVNTTHDDHLPALTQRSLHIYEGVELPETWLHPPSRQEMSVTCIETASFDAAEDAGLKKRTIKLFRAIIAGDLNLVGAEAFQSITGFLSAVCSVWLVFVLE